MVDTDRVTGAVKELGGKVQSSVGDPTGSQRDSIEGRANEAVGSAERNYGRAKDTVRQAASDASDYAEDTYRRGRHYLSESHERSIEWPHTSLLIAGLVGFGLGLLVSRR